MSVGAIQIPSKKKNLQQQQLPWYDRQIKRQPRLYLASCLLSRVPRPMIFNLHQTPQRSFQSAEETALVLGQESNGDSLRQKYQQSVITLFDTDTVVSGLNQRDNELANWQEIAPGSYTFPFALKVPNVNFPPCIPGVEGFSIRYVWTAQVDGPFEASLASEEVVCQFMPNVLAPKPMEWTYNDTVGVSVTKGSTHQLHKPPMGIALSIKMLQQIYVPGDPLSMATTVINNSPNKVAGIDVILRRTVKGTVAASYANLSHQSEVEIMTESVDCKVRPGETGQADILTTIPPMSKFYSVPTFESNFLKVYYELLCVVRVKRSVFAGGDTTYQCAIPVPIATHNIDNPIISGRTPRWTKSRMQPYFFDHLWSDPVGDLPSSWSNTATSTAAPMAGSVETSSMSPSLSASASAVTLVNAPAPNTNALQDFLNSGSAELHRERTLKKSLTRSKSLKDIQSARLNGSSWRAERDQLVNQTRDQLGSSSLNRSTTDVSQSSQVQTQGQSNSSRRSPPLNPKNRSCQDEKPEGASSSGHPSTVDSNGNVAYTPPPPPSIRPQRAAQRDLSPEQQAELARKASRRILPNQGQYTNEGVLPPVLASSDNQTPPSGSPVHSSSNGGYNNSSSNGTGVSYPVPSNANSAAKPPPRRNASLTQKSHQLPQSSNGAYTPDQDTIDSAPRGASYTRDGSNGQHESGQGSRSRSNNSSGDQGSNRQGQYYDSSPGSERVPYQHSLPAHQQPPGVVVSPVTSPSLIGLAHLTNSSTSGVSNHMDQTSSRREASTTNGMSVTKDDGVRQHQRHGSSGSNGHGNTHTSQNNGNHNGNNTGNPNGAAEGSIHGFMTIPSWERVERVHHQNWFRPGPHQTGAMQTFDVPAIPPSTLQSVPIMKRTLQRPVEAV
ncbi:hypothetical protein BGZ70_004641 [Mortierella alpina]|uniref:Arrestin C-terminal-like domain-containing protein n=1 Tax=Mortierella alpina TaxID=64518 RepID=A0A9P6JA48_MORAP|nr:hypothetical protein BGZ70_004641 [Mortierella alpina]